MFIFIFLFQFQFIVVNVKGTNPSKIKVTYFAIDTMETEAMEAFRINELRADDPRLDPFDDILFLKIFKFSVFLFLL